MTDGWKGITLGLPQSYLDLETAAPGMGAGIWLGDYVCPLLAPLALRARPLSAPVKGALGVGVVALVALGRRYLIH